MKWRKPHTPRMDRMIVKKILEPNEVRGMNPSSSALLELPELPEL
jgi:hypothetical protein